MTTGIEIYNEAGQRIVSHLDRQLVLTHKGTYTTARHGGATYSIRTAWFRTFTVKHKPSVIALKANGYCFYTCYYGSVDKLWYVTVYSTANVALAITVYIYSDISDVQLTPSSSGYGLEVCDDTGKVVYSTLYRHFVISTLKTGVPDTITVAGMGAGKALAVSSFPGFSSYSGNINSGDGANVNWIVRGYYIDASGTLQAANMIESTTSEFELPVALSYSYTVFFMAVDTANIDRKYPSTYTLP